MVRAKDFGPELCHFDWLVKLAWVALESYIKAIAAIAKLYFSFLFDLVGFLAHCRRTSSRIKTD
jgi:hypothetical protein